MKKITIITTISLMLTSSLVANSQNSPEELFKTKCVSCHLTFKPSILSTLVAPPIMGVMRHVKMSYPNKDKAIAFMKDYILNPSQDKSICKPQKIKRFGLMPSQKGLVTEKELDIILPWIYDNFPPKGFKGMGRVRGY